MSSVSEGGGEEQRPVCAGWLEPGLACRQADSAGDRSMSRSASGLCDVGVICSQLSSATRDRSGFLWTRVNGTSTPSSMPSANILSESLT